MKKIVRILGISMLIFGCHEDNQQKLKDILPKVEFWDYTFTENGGNQVYGAYKFEKNSNCLFFSYRKINTNDSLLIRVPADSNSGDVIEPNTWSVINDSLVYIRGMQRSVVSISTSKDSICLINRKSGGDTSYLINYKVLNLTNQTRFKK